MNHIIELNKIDKMRGEGRLDGNIRNWRDIHIGTVTSLINMYSYYQFCSEPDQHTRDDKLILYNILEKDEDSGFPF
jgi:hypothetical protein